jgi:hypothetical protein
MKPQRGPEWLAAGLLALLLSGCPQFAGDEFIKAQDPPDSDDASTLDSGASGGTGGSGGSSGNSGNSGNSGTTPSIDLSATTAASVGGSSTTQSTSQGGSLMDAGPDSGDDATDGDADEPDASSTTEGIPPDAGDAMPPECIETDEICDGIDNDCDTEPDQEDTCEAGCWGFALNGHGYMFCDTRMGTSEAAMVCSEHGLSLVQIDSAEENSALVEQTSLWFDFEEAGDKQPAFWTGATDEDIEGNWLWVGSGTPFWTGAENGTSVEDAFVNWGEGKPNQANRRPENCAVVYLIDGEDGLTATWNDLPCYDEYGFVCEAE